MTRAPRSVAAGTPGAALLSSVQRGIATHGKDQFMGSKELLMMTALALPPTWLAARLWWSARHAVDELRESCAWRGTASTRMALPTVLPGQDESLTGPGPAMTRER